MSWAHVVFVAPQFEKHKYGTLELRIFITDPICSSRHQGCPVDDVECGEQDWYDDDGGFLDQFRVSPSALADHGVDHRELKQHQKDEHDAHHHPVVQVADVTDLKVQKMLLYFCNLCSHPKIFQVILEENFW